MQKKASSREASRKVLAEPASLDRLCSTVAGGGTLDEWCKASGTLYQMTYEWVHGDPDRLKAYAKALEARGSNITDRVIRGFRQIADADLRETVDAKGKPIPLHKLPDSVTGALAGHEVTVDDAGRVTTKFKTNSRERALESLGRHVGMFKDKLEVSGDLGFADRLSAARRRSTPNKG